MHITTKDAVQNEDQAKALGLKLGTHILTCLIEGDGAVELASDKATIDASVISKQRTAGGGVQVQVAVQISEPVPEAPPVPKSPRDEAMDYLRSKGLQLANAAVQIDKFGIDRILAKRDAEAVASSKQLDGELDALLAAKPDETPVKPEEPTGAVN